MLKILFCTARTRVLAARIVDRLRASGFDANDVSLLMRKESSVRNSDSTESQSDVSNNMIANKLNWLENAVELAVPCSGAFVAAGPLIGAFAAEAYGNPASGLRDTLVGLGLLENNARQFEGMLDEGRCLIAVHTESLTETNRAIEMLEDAGGEDISMASQLAFTGNK